ncbi:MAG TPA: glucoamylase family protein [Clostridiales bacterium]|nr:glucoamylase family protein [Clostridiales bacterium]
MPSPFILILSSFMLISGIGLVLWIFLIRSRMDRKLNMRKALLTKTELDSHAKATASEHVVGKRKNYLNLPLLWINQNYDIILSVYKELNAEIRKKRPVPPAAEWLLDNFYLIEEQVNGIRRDFDLRDYFKLPVLKSGFLKGYARVFAIAVEIILHTDGQVNEKVVSDYLEAYQSHNNLSEREIWNLPLVIRMALIDDIKHQCVKIRNAMQQWRKADDALNASLNNGMPDTERILKAYEDSMESGEKTNDAFLDHLLYRLRRSGQNHSGILIALDKFHARSGITTPQIIQREHMARSVNTVSLGNCITSLRLIATLDWGELLEKASRVNEILSRDPDGTYPKMDSATRSMYRGKVEALASFYGVSEIYLANELLALASQAFSMHGQGTSNPEILRTFHVGYYLIGKGAAILKNRLKQRKEPSSAEAVIRKKHPGLFYFMPILLFCLVLTATAALYAYLCSDTRSILAAVIAGLCTLLPSSEIAVIFVNRIVCRTLPPFIFPRLELRDGIPEEMSTVVAVPTLLSDVGRVHDILKGLEGHYLANREKNLYFALIGACRDADSKHLESDAAIIETALKGIRELNAKYAAGGEDIFFFFNRERRFSACNNKWIGWERKRGALIEFNDLVLGFNDTSFTVKSNESPPFSHIRYIITLDCDTVLPFGAAKSMIGVMAHPLNRPVADKRRNIIAEGYGIMQPSVEVDLDSANQSIFSRILTGQAGIDPYANAVSNVYQDLFGEGIFTGKGIYDLEAFQSILKQAIPENAVLSHDLLEGCFIRAGLISDLKLVDSYPSKFNSYSARQHRWIRGDWQLVPFLFRKIRNSRNEMVPNPLTLLSRMKIFDNLRRSLIAPSLVTLCLAAFSILPGSFYLWLGFFLAPQFLPVITEAIHFLLSRRFYNTKVRHYIQAFVGLRAMILQAMLNLLFLPYQAWLMLDAIAITLVRVFITKKNMLEWLTAADAEKSQKNSVRSYLRMMRWSFPQAAAVPILAFILKPETLLLAAVLFAAWSASFYIAWLISRDIKYKTYIPTQADRAILGTAARKTWRFFEEFAGERDHYLAPDNYQEDPPKAVAHRTSPTNIGLGLMAAVSACDLGYIPVTEMASLLDKTLDSIEALEKWNGHLYNWYDTLTMKVLPPGYVSSVDSGNLAGYLITVSAAMKEYLNQPLADMRCFKGLEDTLNCAGSEAASFLSNFDIGPAASAGTEMDLVERNRILYAIETGPVSTVATEAVWQNKIIRMLKLFKTEAEECLPWTALVESMPACLTPEGPDADISGAAGALLSSLKAAIKLKDMPAAYRKGIRDIDGLKSKTDKDPVQYGEAAAWFDLMKNKLEQAAANTAALAETIEALARRAAAIADAMNFTLLYDEKRQLFSTGFSLEDSKLSIAHYDLLASEARQTSFIAIAKNQVPVSHWYKMSRLLTVVDRYKGLLSWTGTMFEYLMPLLIMRTYRNSLLDESYSFAIRCQKKYAKQRNMPWGISESCFNSLDKNLNYQYKAIGIPALGLKRGLIEDSVAAPYATFLALAVDPEAAVDNIEYLKEEGLAGPYGFYEAVDYTKERLAFETRKVIIKSYMAHHLGMSLVAMNNFLNGNIMQKRFHSDPEMNAARLLLQEKIPENLLFAKETKEVVLPYKGPVLKDRSPVRRVTLPGSDLTKAHILTNGNYSVMVTGKGTGYSRTKTAAITRWRADNTLDRYGTFFYIRNCTNGKIWSAAYSPLNQIPDDYEVTFSNDKAVFSRLDGTIRTKTEIIVTLEDNVEIRRLSLKNSGDSPAVIEVTSYFEVVIAPAQADIAHPAFSNLFVETSYSARNHCIFACRRPRTDTEKPVWLANTAVAQAELLGSIRFETDRLNVIGRSRDVKNPALTEPGKLFTNTVGPVLDPVMCIRGKMNIGAGETAVISFITAISDSNEQLVHLMDKYSKPEAIESAFMLAFAGSLVETRYFGASKADIELYQELLNDVLFLSPLRSKYSEQIALNKKGQSALWRYGISGDNPILFVILSDTEKVAIINEAMKAREYWQLMGLTVDLIIFCREEQSYFLPLHGLVTDIVATNQAYDKVRQSKGIFILDSNQVLPEDIPLFYAAACITLTGEGGSLAQQTLRPPPAAYPPDRVFTQMPKKYKTPPAAAPKLHYFNGTGGFSADGKEYVVQLENGSVTPAPWINVVSNPRFGFMVSESGSGYTWYGNSRENKLTPWSNDAVCDPSGEMIYLSDAETGQYWSITALPVRKKQLYTAIHGFGYSAFELTSHGFKQRLTQFVPVGETVKVSIVNLKNATEQRRKLTLIYYIRPILGVTDQSTAFHIRTGTTPSGLMTVENPYNEEYPGLVCFVDSSLRERCVTGDRKEFFGDGGAGAPACLFRESLSGQTGIGFDPCAAMRFEIDFEPNESKDVVLLLGAAPNIELAEETALRYTEPKRAVKSLLEVKEFWENRLENISVSTPSFPMNLMLDGWLQYQILSCRLWARTGFYQCGGAYGFRDQLQDCLALAQILPDAVREQILLHARHQYIQGDVQHWWHEPNSSGTRTRISDDRLWLPYAAAEYIRITGDEGILNEQLEFLEDSPLAETEDERYGRPKVSESKESLYEHCARAIDVSLKFGARGLPLMGSGDWNDAMNAVGSKGKGESVWLAWFLSCVLDKFTPLCEARSDTARTKRYKDCRAELIRSIEENAWDGNWYMRAFFDNGEPLGSSQNTDCRIDSISQSWSVLSGAGEPKRAAMAMAALEENLVNREYGIIQLLKPPFDKGDSEPGYIKGYYPGIRENGGQYTHAAVWAVIAFALQGDGDKAWELFELINPVNHSDNSKECARYRVEPYVMCADVYAAYPHLGMGGWSWYTGAAGWMYQAGLEYILGFRKHGEYIVMKPCIPRKWRQYTIEYKYMDSLYNISVSNPQSVCGGVTRITVDGTIVRGDRFRLVNDGKVHRVEVTLGR